MSDTTTYSLIIATFADETSGVTAVAGLVDTFRNDRAAMPAAASIVKDATGALVIKETADIGAKQGAAAGALAGGLLGLFSRKRGTVSSAAFGALVGGVAAHKLDTGIPDPRLEEIGASLAGASSAAVAILSDSALAETKTRLAELSATIAVEPFDHDTDFVQQMKDGNFRQALGSLATRAESMVATAGSSAGDLLHKTTEAGRELVEGEKQLDDGESSDDGQSSDDAAV